MTNTTLNNRPVGCERAMLMLPFNVVLAARIKGSIDTESLKTSLHDLRNRHPMLAVRVVMNQDGSAYYSSDDVPLNEFTVESRNDETQWQKQVQHQLQKGFSLKRGPLVRCALVHSPEVSEIILCAHHAICDGMSLGYLLRDLLTLQHKESTVYNQTLIPPPVNSETVPTPPPSGGLKGFIIKLINKKWASKNISFNEEAIDAMHRKFWQSNGVPHLTVWQLDKDKTSGIISRCRQEKVTVNSVLWTAFLGAQYTVQQDHAAHRNHSALAVNTRDKLNVPAGESFGFFASSLSVTLSYKPQLTFWENARNVHAAIMQEMKKTNLFRMLVSDLIHPTLLDSLYFQKYGLINEKIPAKFLRRMGWHKITYGYAFTNVGVFDIPTKYGALNIEEVYGPLFYSDIEEKMVGAITVGGQLTFLQAVNKKVADKAEDLQKMAIQILNKGKDS